MTAILERRKDSLFPLPFFEEAAILEERIDSTRKPSQRVAPADELESDEVYLALMPVVLGIVLASNSEPLFHLFRKYSCSYNTEGERRFVYRVFVIGQFDSGLFGELDKFSGSKHTSALTLQVLGNAKSAVAAVVLVLIFKNPVNIMGMTGFGVTIMGVVLYSEAKKRSKIILH
ncbi:hypothetical protein IFM89_004381 [Coptis chinensis]|uniref:Sugar phosphate transporter domain-containing protein n=1 Tax=Coptis chinensis TaxID=261450 RepID=A0A835IMN0_9MAGN|nr:hypothetical protein IFM89_004381 [Coptis chinensis]